jgi:hypothetical protein
MRETGVDLRQDRLKDALGSVEAALKIPLGLLFHRGDHFFQLHVNSPFLPVIVLGYSLSATILLLS